MLHATNGSCVPHQFSVFLNNGTLFVNLFMNVVDIAFHGILMKRIPSHGRCLSADYKEMALQSCSIRTGL
jgi:hypothetical protein